jgi:hypothetical protein
MDADCCNDEELTTTTTVAEEEEEKPRDPRKEQRDPKAWGETDGRTGLRRRSNGSHEDVKFFLVASFLDSPALFFPRSPWDGWVDGWMLLGRGWLAEYIYIEPEFYY